VKQSVLPRPVTYLLPVVAIVFGVAVLGETVTARRSRASRWYWPAWR
jgi:hypothetical protein